MVKKFFYTFFIRSWWVITFLLFCFFFYEKGLERREQQYQQLNEQLKQLQWEKKQTLIKQQNLQLQVNSQSDLSWIELTLMKELGLSPEGQQKVYFEKQIKDET
jgi:cell division protein FtsL